MFSSLPAHISVFQFCREFAGRKNFCNNFTLFFIARFLIRRFCRISFHYTFILTKIFTKINRPGMMLRKEEKCVFLIFTNGLTTRKDRVREPKICLLGGVSWRLSAFSKTQSGTFSDAPFFTNKKLSRKAHFFV